MKLILSLLIFTLSSQAFAAETLGFYCQARHVEEERNRIFFYVVLDTESYNPTSKKVTGLLFERVQDGGPYTYVDFNAFYVSESKVNPEFYVRQKYIPFGEHELNLEIYPLAKNTLGYSYLEIQKDGKNLNGYCERADYYDGFWR